jgi:hypothetical protein
MITKFGNLFAGHVDLDDMGFEGTPVDVVLEQLDAFGRDVMHKFKAQA